METKQYTVDKIKKIIKSNAIEAIGKALDTGNHVVIVTINKDQELIRKFLEVGGLTQEQVTKVIISTPEESADGVEDRKFGVIASFLAKNENVEYACYFDDEPTNCEGVQTLAREAGIEKLAVIPSFILTSEKATDPEFSDYFICMLNATERNAKPKPFTDKGKLWLEDNLFSAAKKGDVATVHFFLEESGADMNLLEIIDAAGDSLIVVTAKAGQEEVFNFLSNFGANGDVQDKANKTPRQYLEEALEQDMLKKQASEQAADTQPDLETAIEEDKIEIVKKLLDIKKINAVNEQGNTLLHRAFDAQSTQCIIFLLEKGADITLRNNDDKRPYELLDEEEGWDDAYKDLLKQKIIESRIKNLALPEAFIKDQKEIQELGEKLENLKNALEKMLTEKEIKLEDVKSMIVDAEGIINDVLTPLASAAPLSADELNKLREKIDGYQQKLIKLSYDRKNAALTGAIIIFIGAVMGIMTGFFAGFVIGSIVPVLGNIVGGLSGACVGGIAGASGGAIIGALGGAAFLARFGIFKTFSSPDKEVYAFNRAVNKLVANKPESTSQPLDHVKVVS